MNLRTMPGGTETRLFQTHDIALPRCCPVSGNPQPGSVLRVSYRAAGRVLEVYALEAYVRSFVGGHEDGTRNMEAMIERIAAECARTLGVPVRAHAHVLLQRGTLDLTARARP